MKQVDLSKYDNSWYKPGSILKRISWYIFGRVFVYTYLPIPIKAKVLVLKLFGAKIGKGVVIKPKVNIKYPWFLEVGENTWIGESVWIDNLIKIRIGKNCCISQGALLLSGNHDYKSSTFDLMMNEIVLEDGVWVSANSLVTGGVTMRSHSFLTAGSVLSKSTAAYEIWQGNPATFLKKREIVK